MIKRVQFLLDEDRYSRLEQQAARRGASVATLMREAIDTAFPLDGPSRSEAASRLLNAEPIPVIDWAIMKTEIDSMYEPSIQ